MTITVHLGFWLIPAILTVLGLLYAVLAPTLQGEYRGIGVFGRLIVAVGLCLAMWGAYSCFVWLPSGGWQFSFLALAIAGTVIGGVMIARALFSPAYARAENYDAVGELIMGCLLFCIGLVGWLARLVLALWSST